MAFYVVRDRNQINYWSIRSHRAAALLTQRENSVCRIETCLTKTYSDRIKDAEILAVNLAQYQKWLEQQREQEIKDERAVRIARASVSVSRGGGYFASMDLRTPSNATAQQIDVLLKGTPLQGLGAYYVQAEKQYGVNAVFLLALSIHESGWGSSKIAVDKNNLFGMGACDRDPYGCAFLYPDKGSCILDCAEIIQCDFLNPAGKCFGNGYNTYSVGLRYASDPLWADKVTARMTILYKALQAMG